VIRSLLRASLPAALLLAAQVAAAQEPAPPPPLPPPASATAPPSAPSPAPAPPPQPEEEGKDGRPLPPLHVDVRGTLNTDVLLAYVAAGVNADLGLIPVGPGTIAVGAAFEYAFCGSVCWLFSAVTPLEFSQRQISPQARAGYHLALKGAKNLDVYPFVSVGPVFARAEISVDNGLARYVGTDTGIGVALGAGISYFVAGPLFLGGEGRIRYAAGEYTYKLESGDGSRTYDKGSVDSWSLTGIDILLAIGVRVP
jgi:hypothetical protein